MTDDILHPAGIGAETSDRGNPESGADILHAPNLQQAAQRALINVPTNEDDYDARVRAKTLSEALGKAIALAKRDSGKNEGDTPEEADRKDRVQADAIGAVLSGRHDYYGSMWNGRKPFATGAEYAQHMRNIVLNGPSAALSEDSKKFYAADYDTQCQIAAEKEGVTEYLKGAAADVLDAFRVTKPLTRAEEAEADEETIRASATLAVGNMGGTDVPAEKYKAAEQKVREYRDQRRREEIRSKYEAKLNRENAWNALTTILPTLSDDAQECAKAILDSDNNALPVKYYAKFNGLSERERNLLIQTRQLSADKIDSGFWNTIEDAFIGAGNITGNIITAPIRQGVKFVTMARNSAKDPVEAGIDVNNIAITRQLLWQATGDPFAGGDLKTGQLPQLQFEQVCDEHGVAGEAVIGAVSTLPYMGAAMIPYAGPALVALEAMQEMDDHVSLNGGDTTDPGYLVSSFILGGLYSYVEKLQVEKLIGGVSEQGVREGLLKGFYAGIKNGTVPRVLVSETLSESLQEGLQNGIMAINNAYALKEDVVRSFGEAFVEDFIGSLGTMAIIGAGGTVLGHMKRSGWHLRGADGKTAALLRHEERSTDLTNVYLAEFAHNNMVKASGRSDEIQEEGRRRQQSALWGFWQEGGKAGLIEKAGVSDKAAESLDRLFTSIREAEGATAKADEALQEWNRGRGVTSAPKAGDAGDIGQQYLEQLVGGAIRGEISEEDFVGRLMDLGFSARGARDYATFTTLENSVVTEQKAIQTFLQGRYEREAGSEDAQNADYEKVQGAIRDLDRARSVWAQGFGIYRSEEDGKITDPGAAALEKFGFTKEDAKRISKIFHYERAAAFSPIALDGIRAMYERATRGKVSAKAAIASEFQGRVVRLSTGTDAKGKPVYGDFIRFTRNGQTGYVQILDSKTGAPDFSEGNVLIAESIAEATKHKKTPITVQQWMDATPAERENLWNQYHLYDEGFFTEMTPTELTVAADPSARVDSEQAKILLYGTITLATDPSFSGDRRTLDTIRTVDSSAGFHEIYHAWSYFMQQTGKWSEKDDEELQKKYGRAKSGGHNEEAAANALRAYINRRIEGRMTGEDEKSPFAKIFALAKQLRRHADEKRVKARAAATAEETFFDQIIVDNFTGVGEISKQPEAPKPAENGKTSAPTTPQMPGRTDNGADNGATEPEKKPEPAEKPAEPEKPKSTPKPAAQRGWTAYTPTGNVKVGGHYAVVNLSEVIHSNNPAYALYMRAQLRNRKDNKAEEDTRKDIVNNFQGERLLEAPDTANGAPIVFIAPDEKGVKRMFVLSGNGRILVLNELAERHMYDKYRNVMKAWAAENGLEVPEGDTPVLVRVITDLGGSTLEKVADLSNTNSIQQYTEEEQARADAEIIKSLGIARLYHANVNGSPDMTPGVNDDFFAEFIRGVGDTSLYNSDRSLTETARIRAVRALLAITVGQGERGRDVVKKLIEQTDTLNIVRQKNAAAIMAAAVAGLETNDAYSIGPDVSRAMADYIDFAEKKKAGKVGTFDEYFAQMDLLDGPSEISREILKLFGSKQSASDIAEYVNKYCEAAAQSDPTGGLFGEAGARTRIQIWNDATKTVDEARSTDAERHSVATLEDPGITKPYDPITKDEMNLIAAEIGTTDDPANVGFILPDGRLVKYLSHIACVQPVIFSRGIRYSEHSGYRMVGTALKSGMVRTGGLSRAWIQLGAKPSQKQRDAIRDYMEAQRKSSHYSDFTIEVEGEDNVFHSATYSLKVSPSRIFDDIDNFYDNGIEPQGQSFLSQFFHWSIASCDFEAMNRYYDGDVRSIARMLKVGDGTAISMAAGAMARAIRPGDVLIPVPSHDGRAHDTLLLADAISRITGSPVVEAIRGTVRDPIYDLKARGYLPDAEDLGFYRAADIPEDRRAVFIDNVVGTGTTAVAARQALGRGHVVAFAWDHTAPHPVGVVGGLAERHSISSLYTGSAADYEKPSLLKVGTGEGSQVYGLGLYASSERGVAERYAELDRSAKIGEKYKVDVLRNGKPFKESEVKLGKLIHNAIAWGEGDYKEAFQYLEVVRDNFDALKAAGNLPKIGVKSVDELAEAARFIEKHGNEFSANVKTSHGHVYEQTFFTNRAPGDESHLLKWYEPVGNENFNRIVSQAAKEPFAKSFDRKQKSSKRFAFDENTPAGEVYNKLSTFYFNTPQAASEFLARADIDGIKYPVDSYGKTVKDGDLAGWNYVSFRDDNISVDHKWIDGQQRFSITTAEDAAHADAIKRGDTKTAARLVREAAEKSGYVTDSSYQGTSAFNGAAPSANGYYANKEERKAAWEDGSFEGETTFGDYIFDGIDINNLDYILGDERYRRNATPERKEAVDNLRKVLSAKGKTIRMYRSVPSNVKEGTFRNGDWITPSRSYAVENARIHGWEENYRIIEQDVSVEDVWWDGNDVAEWGYDDGKEYAYRNTPNNRKLLTIATYDDAGNLIPLSQRFNPKNPDIRYSFAIGEVGAANLQDALFTAANLKKARELLAGRDWAKIPRPERIRIKFATGWEVGADGKWRMEKPDLPPVSLRKFKVDQSGDPKPTKEMTAEDEGATNLPYLPTTLGKLFPKAELFSSYPWLKSTKVLLGSLPQDGSLRGSYNEESGEIKLRFSKAENAETIHTTLVHEIQHAIQRIEDFARGGNRGIVQKIFMERFKKAKEEAWPLYHEVRNIAERHLDWSERFQYFDYPKRNPLHLAALDKLRTFDDFRDWERRVADFKKKWKHGIDFFTDSDFTAWGRAFKSSFKDYTKLAGEVEARNAAARHYKTILDLRGAYAAKPDFPVLLEDTEDVDRRYQTLLNGAMEQFEKLKSQEDRDARHSFAGVRAANLAGVGSLDDAEVLEKRGEDRETIFKLTGWWRGVDGHWRVELPFHGRFELEGDFDQGTEKGYRTISDYFEWEELFSSYPELRDVEVRFEDMPDEIRGDFDPKTKTIRINKSLRKESANVPAKLKVASVMVHEIQHAIQSIENHARGGDPEQFLTWDATKIHDEIRRLELQRELTEDADEKESIDEMIQEHEIALRSDAEDAERKYYSLAGEVEARNAAERFFESPAYRLANPPWTTQDTFDNQQILDFEPDGAQWSADIIDNGSGKDRYSIVSRLDEEREKIEAEGGKLLLAFHGTQQGGFTRFDQEKNDDGQPGFYFSSDRDTAMTYSSAEKYDPYEDDYSPAMFEDGNALHNAHGIYNVALRMMKPIEIEGNGSAWHSVPDPFGKDGEKARTREIVAKAFEKGYDGVVFKNILDNGPGAMSGNLPPSNVYVVRNPEQVKSVDSVTYDDAGQIIPDDRRLDWNSGDIRYSIQAWPENFPKVKIVTTLDFIKRKHEDLHKRAKAGSLGAAMELVNSIIGPATIKGKPNPKWDSIRSLAAEYPGATLVPSLAQEATGHNMIPFAYARKIHEITGMRYVTTIRQVVRANHTGADAFWRMTHRPEFIGNVMRGRTYIVVDDHVTMGGTLSEIRRHILERGGKVVAATTLTASRFSDILSLRQGTLEKLVAKFGKDLGKELHEAGIANVPAELTEAEARYLLKLSPDTLRDRLNGSALERRALGSLSEGSVQARGVRSAVLPGSTGGVGDRANGSSGSGRSSASHVNDFPGFSEYKDPDGNFGPTRWAKAAIFNGRISKELNKVIDDALAAGDLPGESKLDELTKLIGRAKATKEGQLVLGRYKSGDSFDGSEAQKNDPKRQAVWQRIRQELILDPISSVNNEGLAVSKKTGKPKNASTIEASNAANPDLPAIANDATASYDPICDRRLDIVIGPPAAGKSSVFVDRLSIYYRSRVMDSDAIKLRLPGFDKGNGASFVHEESSYVNKMLLAELLEANKGENIVLPIVGSTAKKIRSYIDMFRNRGYTIYLHNNYVPIVHAFARALVRTTSTGRWIAPEVFLDCLDRPSAAFEEVKDEVDGWDEFSNDVPLGMEPIPARGNYKDPAYGKIEFAGEKVESPSEIRVTPQLVFDFANALDLEEEFRKPIFPKSPRQGMLDFGDAESRSRHAIRSDLQENTNKAAEEALTNYLTYFRLSHSGKPRANTIARMGLAMGMNVVNPKRLLDKAESRAEQVRGTLIEKAAANGDVATTLALLKREDGVDDAVGKLIAGGISKGGELTHKGVGQINSIIGKRVEQMMRDFTAASLADMEGETGLDIAAEILEQNPDAFADEVKKAKGADPEKPQDDEGSDTDVPGGDAGDESGLSDYERHRRAVAREEALKKVEAFIAAAKARAAANKAKAEERRKRHETVDLPGDGNGEGSDGEAGLPRSDRFDPTPKNVKANFKSKEEFAAFMRVWAEHKFDETHGISTLGKTERDKLFAEFYRITVKQELQDLADKLLAPKDENGVTISRIAKLGNGARVHVNRRLAEMEKGVRPDTIERMSAEIFAFINSAAIRVSRTDLVKKFKKRIRDGYIKGAKYEDLKLDADRRVTGWVEEAARYICRVCDLSKREINGLPSQLAAERKELHDIINRRADVYDESGKQVAKAAVEDMETKKAMWKLALLDKYGAMTSLMPGEILDLQNQAIEYLDKQAADLEQLWRDTRAYEEGIRRDLTAAIVAPGGQRYKEKGWLDGRLFDALNGLIRLRLQHLTRFASDADRQKASEAINKIIVMLGDGETQYNRALQDDRRALFEGLGRIFQKPEGGVDNAAIKKYLDRMTEPIPKALAKQISNQGFADSMTYGQMLQLLVSLEQRSFREAIEHNGRQGQADLIRNFETADEKGVRSKVFTAEDNQFVEWLRAFYAAKRDVISPVTLRMVGQKVDSPDPLYCPVKRSMEDRVQALAEAGSSWDPIAAVFTRRIRNNRDFDEQASVIGMFFDRSDETARLLAWAERGTVIRGVFTSVGVQSAIRRAFGPGELRKIMTQLLATFNGGESRKKSPGELAAVDKALNFTTYAYLGFNPLSAIKQTTSLTVWANALPGGFKDLWKYMSHFDRAALKHLKESDEYKLRYGDDVGSGQDLATKGLNENPGMNPVARMLSGAGMWLLKKGDFAPGGWIAQGLYKDLLNKHLNEGMEFDAADRLAITETFNMLEETQQSGRTYNTNMLTIEHGRIGRLLTQFATSPLQQLQYETQAYREWRDMVRYNMGEKKIAAARQKLVRAVVINHLLLPAALNFVTAMFKLAMGDEPPWEKDGYHWSILTDVLMGQFSRVFFIGAFSQTALKALFMREYPRGSQILPVEGALGMAASVCITAHDVATLNAENIRKDLERMLKATAPTRIPYGIYRRLVGDSDVDRKKAKKGAGKK